MTSGHTARAGELVAVYGTLRRGGRLHHHLGTATGRAVPVGTASITGELYEVAPAARDEAIRVSYPCLHLSGDGRVVVELFEVRDPTLWDDLDELEGFHPDRPDDCEYHRRRVALQDVARHDVLRKADVRGGATPAADDAAPTSAWTYVYVRAAPDPDRLVAGGDWIAAQGDQASGSSYL